MSRGEMILGAILGALLVVAGTGAARGDVQVSEVLYDPSGADDGAEWIEIFNSGRGDMDLSGWSLCNQGPFPTRFYWAFPTGFVLGSRSHVTVHWRGNGTDTATDLFTGTAPANFLCGLGSAPLDNSHGAIAVYETVLCAAYADPAVIRDFVQWGASGAIREPVAVTAGIWTAGDFVPLVEEGRTIAYDGYGDLSSDYFEDPTPSMGAANLPAAGTVFVNGSIGAPQPGPDGVFGTADDFFEVTVPAFAPISVEIVGHVDQGSPAENEWALFFDTVIPDEAVFMPGAAANRVGMTGTGPVVPPSFSIAASPAIHSKNLFPSASGRPHLDSILPQLGPPAPDPTTEPVQVFWRPGGLGPGKGFGLQALIVDFPTIPTFTNFLAVKVE